MTASERDVALGVLVVGAVVFGLLAWWLVPWSPVPGGMPEAAPARGTFTQAVLERGETYASGARWIGWSALAVSLVVAAVFGFTRVGARLLSRGGSRWILWTAGAGFGLTVVSSLATLPLALLSRGRRLDYNLTHQTLGAWLVDLLRGIAVEGVMTALGLVLLVGCARRWRRWWPAVAAGGAAGLVVVGSFLYPVVVEPIFNDFSPMADEQLKAQILKLADEEGVDVDEVLVADASRRTTTLNAYVSGFAGTRRVVVYDNLLDSAPDDQVLSVVAHELAHAKNNDVLVGTSLGAAGAALGVGLLALLCSSAAVRRRTGTEGVARPTVVPLVLALVAVGSLLASPVQSGISRKIETRADVVALETTQDPRAFIALQKQLCIRAVCDPTPVAWAQWWFGTHPTVLQRIALARHAG
ncbi:M48 family metalloprotease [Nocardioides daejeonensis]|uniref:M48 family metalloprotease n=1 Tax=Nocardioides daejeonensis TaxID=1046556 RepID=UPI000D74213A|nr:M48 family metalloprotease [Nocardioides daejeonensis]